MGAEAEIPGKKNLLIINSNLAYEHPVVNHICDPRIRGTIGFLHVSSTNTYLMRYSGSDDLYLNGQSVTPSDTYAFDHGSSIRR